MEWLLSTVVESAVSNGVVERSDFADDCVDSTVMEKNIAYPTDSALVEKLRVRLVDFMQRNGLKIRQTYSRQGPGLSLQVGRFAHAKQYKRMRRALRKLRGFAGRLQRERERQLAQVSDTARQEAQDLIALSKRLLEQLKDRKTRNKLYSLLEQDVDCISRGKARKRYESGTKVGIVYTQKDGFVTAMRSYPGNLYDGHTLDDMLEQSEIICSLKPRTVALDPGYRGKHDAKADVIHRGRKLTKRQKARLRSGQEAMIGPMKTDGLVERCHLKGKEGDVPYTPSFAASGTTCERCAPIGYGYFFSSGFTSGHYQKDSQSLRKYWCEPKWRRHPTLPDMKVSLPVQNFHGCAGRTS